MVGTSEFSDMGVSKNNGTPKSSILIGFSIIDHPFWDTPIFGNIHMAIFLEENSTPQYLSVFFAKRVDSRHDSSGQKLAQAELKWQY